MRDDIRREVLKSFGFMIKFWNFYWSVGIGIIFGISQREAIRRDVLKSSCFTIKFWNCSWSIGSEWFEGFLKKNMTDKKTTTSNAKSCSFCLIFGKTNLYLQQKVHQKKIININFIFLSFLCLCCAPEILQQHFLLLCSLNIISV